MTNSLARLESLLDFLGVRRCQQTSLPHNSLGTNLTKAVDFLFSLWLVNKTPLNIISISITFEIYLGVFCFKDFQQTKSKQKLDLTLVYDRKQGLGIGNQTQSPISLSVSEPKLFFFKKIKKKINFLSCFPTYWGDIDFYKLKIIYKYSVFGTKLGFGAL